MQRRRQRQPQVAQLACDRAPGPRRRSALARATPAPLQTPHPRRSARAAAAHSVGTAACLTCRARPRRLLAGKGKGQAGGKATAHSFPVSEEEEQCRRATELETKEAHIRANQAASELLLMEERKESKLRRGL